MRDRTFVLLVAVAIGGFMFTHAQTRRASDWIFMSILSLETPSFPK